MVEKMCCAAAEQHLPRGRGGWLGTHQLPHQEAEELQLHFQWRLLCSLLAQDTRELPAHCRIITSPPFLNILSKILQHLL